MTSQRQTIGDSLGVALKALKARAVAAFMAARPPDRAGQPLTSAELDALMLVIWQAFGAMATPVSPNNTVVISTVQDTNGDPQLALEASSSGIVDGAYAIAYEVNFASLPTTDLLPGGDGTRTIDNKTWNLKSSVNLAQCVLNGQGLYIRANANNSSNTNTNQSGGTLAARLDFLAPIVSLDKLGTQDEVWIWWMFTTPHTPNAAAETAQLGMYWGAGGDDQGMARFTAETCYVNGAVRWGQANTKWNGVVTNTTGGDGNSCDVYAFRIRDAMVEAYRGSSVGGVFPGRMALTFIARSMIGPIISASGGLSLFTDDAHRAYFTIASGNTAGAVDLLVKKLRVDYLKIGSPAEAFCPVEITDGKISGFGTNRRLLVSGETTLNEIAIEDLRGGVKLLLAFTQDSVVTAMSTTSTGAAAIKTPRMGADTPQDIHLLADDVVEVQLRTDLETPFWKVIGGSFT